jgi:hypothetical protein
MFEALFVAALVVAPLQADDKTRDVVNQICLPYVNGALDLSLVEPLGFVSTGGEDGVRDYASSDEQQAYLLRLSSDDGEETGEVRRSCVLQARTVGFAAARGAVRRPLEEAGFVAEPGQAANRAVWTRRGVTVSIRQNEGRAAVVRVIYSSLDDQ